MNQISRELTASEDEAGERIDRWLAAKIPELSRSRIQALIKAGAVTSGGGFAFLQWASSSETRPITKDLNDLPMQIQGWSGVDRELEEHIAQQVGARESISREYRNPASDVIALHVATWSALGEVTLPHPPKICYTVSGARIVNEEQIEVADEGGNPIKAQLMETERDGARNLVLYWYFWDQYVVTTRWQATLVRLRLSGNRQWPPVVKVLLDAPVTGSSDATRKQLLMFATSVHQWTKDL